MIKYFKDWIKPTKNVVGKKKKYIQISESIVDLKTREREFNSLRKLNDNYPKYVITNDDKDYSNEGIIHLNIINFLKSDDEF